MKDFQPETGKMWTLPQEGSLNSAVAPSESQLHLSHVTWRDAHTSGCQSDILVSRRGSSGAFERTYAKLIVRPCPYLSALLTFSHSPAGAFLFEPLPRGIRVFLQISFSSTSLTIAVTRLQALLQRGPCLIISTALYANFCPPSSERHFYLEELTKTITVFVKEPAEGSRSGMVK